MARVAEDNTSTYIQGSVTYSTYISYSQIVVDVTFQMRRTNPGQYPYDTYDPNATPKICISRTQDNYNYTGNAGITVHASSDWQTIYSASRTWDISFAGATIYVGWQVSDDTSGYLGGYKSVAITLPTSSAGPSGGFIDAVVPSTNSFTMTGGVTTMGGGSQTEVQLLVLNAPFTQAGIPQRYEDLNALSGTKTISNSSPTDWGGITISPNTRYYAGVYAYNGEVQYRYDGGAVVTMPPTATVSSGTVTDHTVVINYSTSADGGFYDKKIQYSLDGVSWVDGATVSTGSASSGSFTISNLLAGTTYNIQTRTTTTAGSSTGSTLTVTTTGTPFNPVLYGSISGGTKEITELYGPAEIPVYEITALTNNIGFDTDAFISKWVEEQGYMTDTPERLEIRNDDFDGHHLRVSFTHSAAVYFASWTGTYDGSLSDWGFDDTPVAGVFSSIITPALATKKITKLYGSVNGQTKLIYEAQQ